MYYYYMYYILYRTLLILLLLIQFTFPLCFQKMAAGISGLKTAQVRLRTDLISM